MMTADIMYLEEKLVERPFLWEELYFEILDHVLCKFESSGMVEVEEFWEREKLNWGWWKIYQIRFKCHISIIWQFLKCYLLGMFSLKRKDLKINSAFLGMAFFLGTNFHHQEAVMTGIVILLMIAYPASIHAWIFHQGNTLGEKLKIAEKGQYTSVKSDALWAWEFFHMMIWSFLFAGSQKYLTINGFFWFRGLHRSVISYHHFPYADIRERNFSGLQFKAQTLPICS